MTRRRRRRGGCRPAPVRGRGRIGAEHDEVARLSDTSKAASTVEVLDIGEAGMRRHAPARPPVASTKRRARIVDARRRRASAGRRNGRRHGPRGTPSAASRSAETFGATASITDADMVADLAEIDLERARRSRPWPARGGGSRSGWRRWRAPPTGRRHRRDWRRPSRPSRSGPPARPRRRRGWRRAMPPGPPPMTQISGVSTSAISLVVPGISPRLEPAGGDDSRILHPLSPGLLRAFGRRV